MRARPRRVQLNGNLLDEFGCFGILTIFQLLIIIFIIPGSRRWSFSACVRMPIFMPAPGGKMDMV
jgi:hypothetical protein